MFGDQKKNKEHKKQQKHNKQEERNQKQWLASTTQEISKQRGRVVLKAVSLPLSTIRLLYSIFMEKYSQTLHHFCPHKHYYMRFAMFAAGYHWESYSWSLSVA